MTPQKGLDISFIFSTKNLAKTWQKWTKTRKPQNSTGWIGQSNDVTDPAAKLYISKWDQFKLSEKARGGYEVDCRVIAQIRWEIEGKRDSWWNDVELNQFVLNKWRHVEMVMDVRRPSTHLFTIKDSQASIFRSNFLDQNYALLVMFPQTLYNIESETFYFSFLNLQTFKEIVHILS